MQSLKYDSVKEQCLQLQAPSQVCRSGHHNSFPSSSLSGRSNNSLIPVAMQTLKDRRQNKFTSSILLKHPGYAKYITYNLMHALPVHLVLQPTIRKRVAYGKHTVTLFVCLFCFLHTYLLSTPNKRHDILGDVVVNRIAKIQKYSVVIKN